MFCFASICFAITQSPLPIREVLNLRTVAMKLDIKRQTMCTPSLARLLVATISLDGCCCHLRCESRLRWQQQRSHRATFPIWLMSLILRLKPWAPSMEWSYLWDASIPIYVPFRVPGFPLQGLRAHIRSPYLKPLVNGIYDPELWSEGFPVGNEGLQGVRTKASESGATGKIRCTEHKLTAKGN